MPDLDELLRERLDRPLAVVPPPLGDLQRRAAHRRHRRLFVAAAGAVAAVAIVVAGTSIAWPLGDRDPSGYAAVLGDSVLDSGTGPDGPWRVVVTRDDGWCVKRVHPLGEGGSCQLASPGQLGEGSQFLTTDGDAQIAVVAGPAPPGTVEVEVTLQGATATATLTEIEGRLFYSVRLPAGDGETRVVAYDQAGAVIDDVRWPPAPGPGPFPPLPPPSPDLPPAPPPG